jgi:uncharacterized protein DUF5996
VSVPDAAATAATAAAWPSLPLAAWRDTYATLHMWTQMVGKTRLALAPAENHWWQVALYVTARGLTTGPMPYGDFTFQIDFDFLDHRLVVATSEGVTKAIALAPRSVADFYREYLATLASLGIRVHLWPMPCEVEHPIRFTEDHEHAAYDAQYATRFWRILTQVDEVLRQFRGRFLGKASPVHFFWGSFDLAASRFNGERAPKRPELDRMMQEAYSHAVISAGFWPGSMAVQETAFYAYAAPEPTGFSEARVQPSGAYYQPVMKEFILPYEAVRTAPVPAAALSAFLDSTYNAAADLAHWDRAKLERS